MIVAWFAKLGIGWVLGPVGKTLGVLAAVLVVVTLIRQDAIRDCQSDQLQAKLKQAQIDASTATGIARTARERADKAEGQLAEMEALTDEILKDNQDLCPVSDDIRERLSRIQ